MIGRLTGTAEQIEDGRCLIDVNGVGYVVLASSRSLAALPAPPARATVLVETQVREDAITLFGFIDSAERDWFLKLVTVQSVGPKLAMAVLSALPPDQLARVLIAGDIASLRRVPGVGPNLAKRLATELSGFAAAMPTGTAFALVSAPSLTAPAGPLSDALSALINLGYRRTEAESALAAVQAETGDDASLDALIRGGLKRLAR